MDEDNFLEGFNDVFDESFPSFDPLQAALEECSKDATEEESTADITTSTSPGGATSSRFGLPPCKVCGAKGTGFHYGVNTCEACKGFFRRSLIRKDAYICRKSSKCELSPGKRNMCAYCRLDKCLKAGMSLQGIKTGRYTYEKRRKDTVEVRLLQADMARASAQQYEEQRQEQIEQLIETVVEARRKHYQDSDQDDHQVAHLQSDFIRRRLCQQQLQETMKLLSPEEDYKAIGEAFGNISKDEKHQLFNQWLRLLERGIKSVINFAKALPGFRQLDMNDQISLFKSSMCEVWLVMRHRAVNPVHNCFTTTTGDTLDITQVYGHEYGGGLARVCERLQRLNLKYEENAILSAYIIFCPDRFELDLRDEKKVTEIQEKFLEALLWMLRKNHSDRLIFPRLTAVLTELRSVTELYHKNNEEILIKNFQRDMVQVPPLFWELVSPRDCNTPLRVPTDIWSSQKKDSGNVALR